uniref:Uncharacterized protein n=1 Tax=Daucus carota subsp. sativus TaxID=79200 RepID=A0A162A8E5_DAUCS
MKWSQYRHKDRSINHRKGFSGKQRDVQVFGSSKSVVKDDANRPYANSSSPRKGEGSSGKSSLACLQDDLFLRIMDETLTRARAHPEEYTLTPEAIQFLTSNVIE